ncbi:MAG TPA: CoA-binding protein [Opitutaceae bacterium]|nr:CoA-binding protein [Opitutaceae bacterium]
MGPGSGFACPITLNSALTPEQQWLYQDPLVIQRILRETRTIAVVGLSTDPQRASWFVASYLKKEGYRIFPVNPKADRILGERAYPDLASIPEPVDLVDVFRPAAECLAVARQAVAARAKALWLQLRLVNIEAAEFAARSGLAVVLDRCVKIEHGRYSGRLHWGGMNTEIVSARKARL